MPDTPNVVEPTDLLAILNHYEDMATACEDAELVFEIMALKQRLGYPVFRPSTPVN